MSLRTAHILLLCCVLWSGAFAALESYRTVKVYINRPWRADNPVDWRFGSQPVEQLGELATRVDAELDKPSTIAFLGFGLDTGTAVLLHMWIAYLLPRHDVLPGDERTVGWARYWLVYGDAEAPSEATLLLRTPAGALYRRR